MATGHMISDELTFPEAKAPESARAMDSSRVLIGLLALAREAEVGKESSQGDSLDGLISRRVLRNLLSALQVRDAATVRHSRRVAALAVAIAQHLGWEGRHLRLMEVSGLLHDVGKIGIPDNVLFKPGKLSPAETELMALHANIAVDVLQACRVDPEVVEILNQAHHCCHGAMDANVRFGREIHQGARILAVADAYDSMATDQVYRDGKPHEEIMEILDDASGTQFDGNVVCALRRWVEQNGLPFADSARNGDGQRRQELPSAQDVAQAGSLGSIFSYLYLLESLYDGFYLVGADLRFVVWSCGAERLLGHSSRELLGETWTSRTMLHADQFGDRQLSESECPLNLAVSSGQPATNNVQVRRKDGSWAQVELQSVPLHDANGQLQGVAEIFRDLSQNVKEQSGYRELKRQASQDALTAVANRGALESQLAQMLERFHKQDHPRPAAVIFLDVDFFKAINDNHGHAVGDQVLIDVAKLLKHETYSGEFIGRYGGEEFVVLCPDTNLEQAVRRAQRLRQSIGQTRMGGRPDLRVTASFGVTEVEPSDTTDSVVQRADKALYQAKESGRNRVCSLTRSDLVSEAEREDEKEQADPFSFIDAFQACIAADMCVYKLGGFVESNNARIVDVTENHVQLQLGQKGLFSTWGGTPERQPISMSLDISKMETKIRTASRVRVAVRITPVGKVRRSETFQERARVAYRTLKEYFVAE